MYGVDDDLYVTPGVSIDLNADDDPGIGYLGALKKKKSGYATMIQQARSKARATVPTGATVRTPGSVAVARNIAKAQVASKIRNQMIQSPKMTEDAKKKLVKTALVNPVAFVKAVSGSAIRNAVAKAKMKGKADIANQKKASRAELKNSVAELKKGVAMGVISPAVAKQLMKKKAQEIKAKHNVAVKTIKAQANKNIKSSSSKIKNEVFKKAVRAKGIALDRTRQMLEDEKRKIETSNLPPAQKQILLKALADRMKRLDVAKSTAKKQQAVHEVTAMASRGIIPQAQAVQMKKNLQSKIKQDTLKKTAIVDKSKMKDAKINRLYVLGKWINAYESAIAYANSVNAKYIILPLNNIGVTMKGKGQQEVRMNLQDAKVKLEKFKVEQKKLEAELLKLDPKIVPPGIVAITQTGQPVTPEMINAQIKYVQGLMASGKMNPVVGATMVMQLQKVQKLAVQGQTPVLETVKKVSQGIAQRTPKPKPTTVVVNISPKAMASPRAGERTVTTKAGTAKTKMLLPKPGIPPAIPHATARTAGTKQRLITKRPKRTPSVARGVKANRAKILPRTVRAGVPSKPRDRTISPFRHMDLKQFLDILTPQNKITIRGKQYPFFGDDGEWL